MAAAAEAVLKKLSAEGLGFDPGALGIVRAVLSAAKLGKMTSPPGESSAPPGKAGAAAGSSDGVDQDLDVDMVLDQLGQQSEDFIARLEAGFKKRKVQVDEK